jgi:3',5'-cyclic AMP phosphodiesterase CpdA
MDWWDQTLKLAILGDLHIISPHDPFPEARERRAHFAQTDGALKALRILVRQEAPDLVISVGDLIDWYSDENRDAAIHFLDSLGAPWLLTPGNHDIAGYIRENGEVTGPYETPQIEEAARKGWADAGIEIGNRAIDVGFARLLLLDSSPAEIPTQTQQWLEESLTESANREANGQTLLFTHKPFNIEAIRRFITSVEPGRDPQKSLQQGMPATIEGLLVAGLDIVFTGHLHFFPGHVMANGLDMYLLPLSVVSAGRVYPRQGTVTFLELDGSPPRQVSLDGAH